MGPLPKLFILLVLLLSSSCATPATQEAWYRWLVDADRDVDHGHYDRADALYTKLLIDAPTQALGRYIRFRQAQIDAAQGDASGALRQLGALQREPNPDQDEWTSRAQFEIAIITDRDLNDAAKATELMRALVEQHPDASITPRALRLVLDEDRRLGDPEGAARWLAELYPRLADTELGDNVLFEIARLEWGELDRKDLAIEHLELHRRAYAFSPLRDDALFKLGELRYERGEVDAALFLFEKIAEVNETSWTMGSYDLRLRNDAMLARADIFIETDQPEQAAQELQRILDTFSDYLGGSEIAKRRADLFRAPLADRERYVEALEAFLDDYPESVYCEDLRHRLDLVNEGVAFEDIPAQARARRRASFVPFNPNP